MNRFVNNLFLILLVLCSGAVLYLYRAELGVMKNRLYETYAPCTRPIEYSISTFDTEFGVSEEAFLKNITEAELLWESAVGKNLFEHTDNGSLEINLVYDYRQEATAKLKKLGLAVTNERSTYDALLVKYNTLSREYAIKKADLLAVIADFEAEQKAYETEVAGWNKKGGAPKEEYDRLMAEEADLKERLEAIKKKQDALNVSADTTNALVTVINRVAGSLNLAATQFNTIGKERGQEFEEGIYEFSATSTKIDIYEFDSNQKLVRVLAHELGHALRLEHVEDPEAIMYKYNQGSTNDLAPDDIAAVKAKCGIQ